MVNIGSILDIECSQPPTEILVSPMSSILGCSTCSICLFRSYASSDGDCIRRKSSCSFILVVLVLYVGSRQSFFFLSFKIHCDLLRRGFGASYRADINRKS